jgi:hypothetical protein
MAALISLIGMWLLKVLPRVASILFKMPLLLAGIGIGVTTFLACATVTNALYDALAGVAASSPQAWCIATAFGAQLGIWWFLQGVTVGLGIFAFKVLKEPILQVVSELKSVAS